MAPVISCNDSQRRIMTLLEFIKENEMTNDKFPIDLTRQQVADLTGLRVETVIRTIKDLESQKQVQIKKGKVFL
ncbi:helix-turn-helix domain-containing protein [Myroides pelagicus]|uniref:Helix-turn-helix domain-containing protein n=2 Tax=Myroides pelagicus TaxID=270914 RepID=A0A7K1GPC3_9FLAO|nr:helix-turn-helix domain-containing protein [Myroides pelagicus]